MIATDSRHIHIRTSCNAKTRWYPGTKWSAVGGASTVIVPSPVAASKAEAVTNSVMTRWVAIVLWVKLVAATSTAPVTFSALSVQLLQLYESVSGSS